MLLSGSGGLIQGYSDINAILGQRVRGIFAEIHKSREIRGERGEGSMHIALIKRPELLQVVLEFMAIVLNSFSDTVHTRCIVINHLLPVFLYS